MAESTPLAQVINKLETAQLSFITVLSPADTIAGVVDRGDITRAIAQKLNLRITDVDIKRIKEEGRYPSGLQLEAIAKSLLNEG